MTITKEGVLEFFPFDEARSNQLDIIQKIINEFDSGKKFVIAEMPTGAGKSAIGYTVGSYFAEYYYITAQKILQSQLSNDFGENGKNVANNHPMVELKGRNAYECIFYKKICRDGGRGEFKATEENMKVYKKKSSEYIDCSVGECKRHRLSKFKYCEHECPYYVQFNSAIRSDAVLMNFHSFIFQTEFVKRWPHKTLLIIDEAHNTEQVLMDYITFTFNDFSYDFDIPQLETAEEYYMFFEDIEMEDIIKDKIALSINEGDSSKEEYWIQQLQKYSKFKKSIEKHEWVPKWEEKEISKGGKKFRTVELKPLYIKDFSHDLLFDKVDKVLLMSATILNVNIMCRSLGIPKSQAYATRVGSDFPVENRPIYYQPSGSMSFKAKNSTMPRMLKDIEKLCNKYSDKRGIIHTHNFEIAKYIQSNCSNDMKQRLFLQTEYMTKDDMLEQHSLSPNGVIIAPAMHEGLDLKNDLARFQILCKVPYPGLGNNPQLKMRMDLDNEYYQYLTALKLVQSYGRSIRSKDDWAHTYILDENFVSFYHRSKSMLPSWFKDAIVW